MTSSLSRWLASFVCAWLTLSGAPARAAVHEIKTMGEILKVIGEDTLVVFDLDNTLLTPAQTLGSDELTRVCATRRDSKGR